MAEQIANTEGVAPAPPRIDWADPAVPAGDAPPMPRWPVYLSGVAWGLCIVFLAVLALTAGD